MAVVGTFFGLFAAVIAILVLLAMLGSARRGRREAYIQNYAWPPGLLDRFAETHPTLSAADCEQVVRGLRQFFIVHLRSDCDYVSMPSRVVDDLWHEFILHTRDYRDFCRSAFGKFLDHLPSAALSPVRKQSNVGLRRTWWWACKDESINPRKPMRLPLLFAIDHQLAIPDGFYYVPDCATILPGGEVRQCGADFASRRIDGSTEGFGTATKRSTGSGGDGCSSCSNCSSCSSCSSCSGSSSSD